MKNKKLLIIILLIGICILLIGCKPTDHKQMEEIAAEYPYEVVLDFNGGRASNYDQIKYRCKSGAKIDVPSGNMFPVKYGYEVTGWYVKPSADSDVADIDRWQEWNFNSDTVTESITLVAKWSRLRSFSIGYYDNVVPEDGGDAVKTWVEIWSYSSSIDGTEFVCKDITKSDYMSMNTRLTGKTLLSGFNSEQSFYSDEGLTEKIDIAGLVHPIVNESDLNGNPENGVYRIYCEYLEGNWTILDSSTKITLTNGNYYLVGDVTLNSSQVYVDTDFNREICTVFNSALRFTGTIKGNGYKIICERPLAPIYERPSTLFIGFFGVLDGATLEDVTFEGLDMKVSLPSGSNESLRLGFLAGNILRSTLKNVTVSGTITIENTEGNRGIRELLNQSVWFGQKDDATIVEGCNFENITVTDNRGE